jgi:hypothetical protein
VSEEPHETLPGFIAHLGVAADEYRKLCLRAFENLPSGTAVTTGDVDSVLTWCLPAYVRLRAAHAGDPGDAVQHTDWYLLLHGHSGPYTREETADAFRAGYLAASPPGFTPAAGEGAADQRADADEGARERVIRTRRQRLTWNTSFDPPLWTCLGCGSGLVGGILAHHDSCTEVR